MKKALGLAISTAPARVDKKYLGDPESPNFLPDSPLIERPVLSTKQESELKWVCGLVLANVKSSDDSDTDPLSKIIQSLQAQEALPVQEVPDHKVRDLAQNGPKPVVSSRHHIAARNEGRPKHEREDAGMFSVPSKPAFTDSPAGQPLSAHSNDEALSMLRSRLSSRPKTSAAAYVEHTGENTDPSSRPSNRTTYTTHSTPATSIGAGGKKSYAQDEPAMPLLDLYGLLSQGESPSRDDAQVRAWMDEQLEHRYPHVSNGFEYPANSLREFYPTPRPEEAEQLRQRMKRNSVRSKVQEYFRPASSSSNGPHRSGVGSNNKNSIRPGSSAGSARSVATNPSTRSRTQEHLSSIKRKLSSASRMSQRSFRKGAVDGDEKLQGEADVDLNRPLPPLPGLDSYKEKKTHIASLMKKVQSPKVNSNAVADAPSSDGQYVPSNSTHRDSNHSMPPSFNMSTASIGSTPTSLDAPSFACKSTSSLDRMQSRSHAGKAGMTVGVSPLSQSTLVKTELKKEGFAKRWGGKLSLSKKPKAVTAV